MKKQIILLTVATAFVLVGCSSQDLNKQLIENPDALFKVIEDNPEKFMQALQVAASKTRELSAKNKSMQEEQELAKAFENPLHPKITKEDAILGPIDSPITLVEYSDFECPYCSRGHEVVKSLLEKYKGKIRFIYKHLPLAFHPQAMIAAQYFEAIKLQSTSLAFKFHDKVFEQQSKLKNGEKFLKELAKGLKVDMKKLKTDLNSKEVLSKIENDKEEAREFGIAGTPGFVLNGIPIRGAYPKEYFVSIIDKLQTKGDLKL